MTNQKFRELLREGYNLNQIHAMELEERKLEKKPPIRETFVYSKEEKERLG